MDNFRLISTQLNMVKSKTIVCSLITFLISLNENVYFQ